MRKQGLLILILVLFLGFGFGCAGKKKQTTAKLPVASINQEQVSGDVNKNVTKNTAKITLESLGSGKVLVNETYAKMEVLNKEQIRFVFQNPLVTPIGVNTEGKNLVPAQTIEVHSGFKELSGKDSLVAKMEVKDNKISFVYPNVAYLKESAPAVEHLWLRAVDVDGNYGAGVLDPKDPLVVYNTDNEDPDLETLAIGFVMYPDGTAKPLKELGQGKLVQGFHPELSN